MKRLPLPLCALLLATGCSPRVMALRAMTPIMDRASAAFRREPDPALAREAFPAQLKLLEGLLESDPGNPTLRRLLAEGFGGYAFLFLEDVDNDRARGAYLRGRDYAFGALGAKLKGLAAMTLPEAQQALGSARPADAPSLFWAAYSWAGWINLSKDSPEAVADLPKVVVVMETVERLSPGFYFGGAELFLGAYEAMRPKMLGGDPAKSKAHFESALKAGGGRFLLAKVLYAATYAVAVQDQELFKRLLDEVLASSPELPEARLANAVAKVKAKRLLERINDLF